MDHQRNHMSAGLPDDPSDEFDLTWVLWGDQQETHLDTLAPTQETSKPSDSDEVDASQSVNSTHALASMAETTPWTSSNTGMGVDTSSAALIDLDPMADFRSFTVPDEVSNQFERTEPDPVRSMSAGLTFTGLNASHETDSDDDESAFDDLDAYAALMELTDLDALSPDEEGSEDVSESLLGEAVVEERMLSYAELTERLRRDVLPRLRWLARSNGYLSLGHLADAIVALQGSDLHLSEVRTFAMTTKFPILPSRSHKMGRSMPLWAIKEAKRRFGDLVHGQPDDQMVVNRFGYDGVPLTPGTRAFFIQAWLGHCLSRAEERAHTETVAAEIDRVGTNIARWSLEARAAREALILDNLWLVARNARRFIGRGVGLDDLLQMGAVGLLRSVEKFEPARGYRFPTYAHWWINQAITRQIADCSRLIRLPVHVHERGKAIFEAQVRLEQELCRRPTIAEIAKASETAAVKVRAHLVIAAPLSLDQSERWAWLERQPSQDNVDPLDVVPQGLLKDQLEKVLASLPQRERRVLELRFGLDDGRERTLEEVGREFGLTRERIRQIEVKALKKLRHPSRSRKLRDFIDYEIQSRPPAKKVKGSKVKGSKEGREEPSVPPVDFDTLRAILPQFDEIDQFLLNELYGLDNSGVTAKSVAEQYEVPVEKVVGLAQVAARLSGAIDRSTSGLKESKGRTSKRRGSVDQRSAVAPTIPADGGSATSTSGSIRPGWYMRPEERGPEDWLVRVREKSGREQVVVGEAGDAATVILELKDAQKRVGTGELDALLAAIDGRGEPSFVELPTMRQDLPSNENTNLVPIEPPTLSAAPLELGQIGIHMEMAATELNETVLDSRPDIPSTVSESLSEFLATDSLGAESSDDGLVELFLAPTDPCPQDQMHSRLTANAMMSGAEGEITEQAEGCLEAGGSPRVEISSEVNAFELPTRSAVVRTFGALETNVEPVEHENLHRCGGDNDGSRAADRATRPARFLDSLGGVPAPLDRDGEKDILLADRVAPAEGNLYGLSTASIDTVNAILSTFSPQERAILDQRLGLVQGRPRPLQEVSEACGVLSEEIRLLQLRLLRGLNPAARRDFGKWLGVSETDLSPPEQRSLLGRLRRTMRRAVQYGER